MHPKDEQSHLHGAILTNTICTLNDLDASHQVSKTGARYNEGLWLIYQIPSLL